MSNTAVAMLPTDGDSRTWSDQEKALVEAAGLVRLEGREKNKVLADRPTVEAFLQHCRRTQLDPIARQIYAIYRGGKWGIQISIDGARLVAERSGKYEGQTTPEFTGDGKTWTEVWLESDQPKAARVGVYKRGFREPQYAVALWDAYAVYTDEWENNRKTGKQILSAMWAKMGPLMLAKCAEMLALRKAFPQDLSGLYSTEEMDQAGAPREVVRQVEQAAVVPFPAPANEAERRANAAATVASSGLGAEVVHDITAPVQPAIAVPVATREWGAELEKVTTLDGAAALYREAEKLGELNVVVGLTGDKDDGTANTVMDLFWARRRDIESAAAETPPLVDVPVTKTGKRQWVREARGMGTRAGVRALVVEATAKGALAQIIEELEAIERTLPDPGAAPVEGGWATAEVPKSGTEWVENEAGEYVETPIAPESKVADQ